MEPSKEIELLKQKLIGLWDVEMKQTMPDGKKVMGTGIFLAKDTALEHAISAELALTVPGMDPYQDAELWGVDGLEKKVHFFRVTSQGEVRDQVGGWKDPNTLALGWKGLQEGKEISTTYTFTWVSPDEIHVLRVDTAGDRKGPASVFNLKRQKEMTLP
jgi:hypothetical protein